MTPNTEALVRRAYHLAEGDVLDVQGFIDLFAEDGVFTGFGGVSGPESYRGERPGDVVVYMGKLLPDVHRELHRVNVLGDVVAIELSIGGTILGPFETPGRTAGLHLRGSGARARTISPWPAARFSDSKEVDDAKGGQVRRVRRDRRVAGRRGGAADALSRMIRPMAVSAVLVCSRLAAAGYAGER